MIKEEILPFQKGDCECCLEENINVIICTSNNKCEYAMCAKCMSELTLITKTNKCPNCRETKIEIDFSSDEEIIILPPSPQLSQENQDIERLEIEIEEDLDRINNCERFGKGILCILKWINNLCLSFLKIPYYCMSGYYGCISECYNLHHPEDNNKKTKVIVLSTMILLVIIGFFLGAATYMIVVGINPFNTVQSNLALFILQSFIGFIILVAGIFILVLTIMCFCSCWFE